MTFNKWKPEIIAKKNKARSIASRKIVIWHSSCSICGKKQGRLEMHHDDYDKPLEIRILCHTCHMKLHAKLNPLKKRDIDTEIHFFNIRFDDKGGYQYFLDLYESKNPVSKISKYFGVSRQTIYNWFDKFGLKYYYPRSMQANNEVSNADK